MIFFANELSFHDQFQSTADFRNAFARLMAIRDIASRSGFDVYCSRRLLSAMPVVGITMIEALQGLSKDQTRSVMNWLTRGGPFYEDFRLHSGDDYFECCDEVVTDSTVGEAAYRTFNGLESCLISAVPSDWDFDPVAVMWRRGAEGLDDKFVELSNWRDAALLETALARLDPPIQSWNDLKEKSVRGFRRLAFADDCFEPLFDGVPFESCVATRFFVLLGILERLARAFNDNGERTFDGHEIYRSYFTGDNALFSDSSETEKHSFMNELNFPHPIDPNKTLCCTWHGKIKRSVMRLHFSWPIRNDEPVYIVYAGPKITKK